MERITDREPVKYVYPHIRFSGVSGNLHLLPFMKQGQNQKTAIISYATKRGTVIETGPFLLNHLSVAHLLYLGIGVELFKDEDTSIRFETTEDLIKIATFASQR
jgi:hypothetical protein